MQNNRLKTSNVHTSELLKLRSLEGVAGSVINCSESRHNNNNSKYSNNNNVKIKKVIDRCEGEGEEREC